MYLNVFAVARGLRRLFLTCLSCLLIACGEDYIDAPDAELTVYIAPSTINMSGIENQPITLNSGAELIIEEAYLSISAAEILPCEPVSVWYEAFPRQIKNILKPLIGTNAYAHSTSSPTRNGTPYWLNLLSNEPVMHSVFYPPSSVNYCQLELVLNRTDEDTQMFAVNEDVQQPNIIESDFMGVSVLITGQYRLNPAMAWQPVSLSSTKNLPAAELEIDIDFSQQPIATLSVQYQWQQWLKDTEQLWLQDNFDEALLILPNYWQLLLQN